MKVVIIFLIIFFAIFVTYLSFSENSKRVIHQEKPILKAPEKTFIYEEKAQIQNKGFVNELMYKPNTKFQADDQFKPLITNTVSLNDTHRAFSSDLPMANINISYLSNSVNGKLIV